MAHSNETLLRDAYAAFGRGDMDGYWRACSDEFAFHVPGRNQVAGRYAGKGAFLTLVQKVMTVTRGEFQEIVEDVLANDRSGVVLVPHRFKRDGVPKEYRSAHVYEIQGGKLTACWEQPRDQTVFDDAWA